MQLIESSRTGQLENKKIEKCCACITKWVFIKNLEKKFFEKNVELCFVYLKICWVYVEICLVYVEICLVYVEICLVYVEICLVYVEICLV